MTAEQKCFLRYTGKSYFLTFMKKQNIFLLTLLLWKEPRAVFSGRKESFLHGNICELKNISIQVFVPCFLRKRAWCMLTWGETILHNKFSNTGFIKIVVKASTHGGKFMYMCKVCFKFSAVSLNSYFLVLGLWMWKVRKHTKQMKRHWCTETGLKVPL